MSQSRKRAALPVGGTRCCRELGPPLVPLPFISLRDSRHLESSQLSQDSSQPAPVTCFMDNTQRAKCAEPHLRPPVPQLVGDASQQKREHSGSSSGHQQHHLRQEGAWGCGLSAVRHCVPAWQESTFGQAKDSAACKQSRGSTQWSCHESIYWLPAGHRLSC